MQIITSRRLYGRPHAAATWTLPLARYCPFRCAEGRIYADIVRVFHAHSPFLSVTTPANFDGSAIGGAVLAVDFTIGEDGLISRHGQMVCWCPMMLLRYFCRV